MTYCTGEGTFSTVFCAKKRLDGTFYAVKRIKKKISSENEGKLIVRESCALASLMNCPYMVRYFGCWIDNGHLHIQTEYCDKGSLDCFVMSTNHRTSDPLIPENSNINFNHDSDEISTSQFVSNCNNEEYDVKNDDESNQIDNLNNDRKENLSNEIRETKNDMNFIENKPIFINDDSQNDEIFSVQKDELQIDNDKENEENNYGRNYKINSNYNNEDDDDNEFLVEDNDKENNNDKDNHSNHNDDNLLNIENDPQLRYSDAIFSVGGEDSRNSDTYSCFSDSNSNNNNYELKYNNKAREYNIKDNNEIEEYENLVPNSDNDTKNLENCLFNKNDDDDDDDDDIFQSKNVEENGEREEKVTEEVKLRNDNHDNNHNNDNDVEKGANRGSEREGEKEKEEGEGEDNIIGNKKPLYGVVNEGLAWVVLHSMASALQYMHSKGMWCTIMQRNVVQ